MKATASRCLSALFLATALAGCMVSPQNRTTVGARSDAPLTTADWAKVIEIDRASVRAGQLPK
ncbi:hypothetical protein [Telmatospirillum sp.]|uniref:hypothetical protein n=1 Tax=Telmatospirillum sp. TaxID=2079197 RepID=UPI00284E114C|nr:hypothetical protein [Telmatospirillum sp.]MDR3440188.1 hypothetical protein [Telmatospirillum sp.]